MERSESQSLDVIENYRRYYFVTLIKTIESLIGQWRQLCAASPQLSFCNKGQESYGVFIVFKYCILGMVEGGMYKIFALGNKI